MRPKSHKISLPPKERPTPEPEPKEHPEDRVMREEGEAYAREHAQAFCDEHRAKLDKLISTYGDGDAETLLDELREKFWARLWTPR